MAAFRRIEFIRHLFIEEYLAEGQSLKRKTSKQEFP